MSCKDVHVILSIVCSLPSVCILLLVYSLYSLQFTLSLYFTPCLQSVLSPVYPQSVFYSLSAVCIVCSLPLQSFYWNWATQRKKTNEMAGLKQQIPTFLNPANQMSASGDLMVSALVSGSSGPGSSPGRSHCVVFLGKTLYSHSASLHPGV